MTKFLFCLLFLFVSFQSEAQIKTTIKLIDQTSRLPVSNATLWIQDSLPSVSDDAGIVNLQVSGKLFLKITCMGYHDVSMFASFPDTCIRIYLIPQEKELEEVTIISSTRTNQPIEKAPIKIEVLESEEMKEESMVKPSNVLGIIGDASGIQIQQSSAISGNSNVRIQGLDGKYTQILRDGLPLYEGFSGGFGLLSVPPLDLQQIELIKGSASTLYGGGAIGGLINLISKKPSVQGEHIITLNQTTLKETNFNSYLSKKFNRMGYTFYAGANRQSAVDVNEDGFSDVSKNKSIVVHPRLFVYPNTKTQIVFGFTTTYHEMLGGDMMAIDNPLDTLHTFFEKNKLLRNSAEFLIDKKISGNKTFYVKSSYSSFNRAISKTSHYFNGKQIDFFSEASLVIRQKQGSWVMGINFVGNQFNVMPGGDSVYIHDVSNQTIGGFVQCNYTIKRKNILEVGIRNDMNKTYRHFLLPRIALFHKFNDHWGARTGVGLGYKIPDALSPQIQEYEIEKILPISGDVQSEKSIGYNAELNYKAHWGDENSIFINHAFFLTQINNPIVPFQNTGSLIDFSNQPKPIVTKGFDTYLKLKIEDWELYAGYTYTLAERKYLYNNQRIPYTPSVRMAYMLTKEMEGRGRFCMEASYNGSQYREDYSKTPDYLFMAAMAEVYLAKKISLVLNCENIFDYRQSKKESLYTGPITNPSFSTLWAPIDGRSINLCFKWSW